MTKQEFKTLAEKGTKQQLIKVGFRKWKEKKPTLMLIPGNLFNSIPKGYPIVDIFGKKEKFDPATSDDDVRFGCLPYGILR